MEAILRFELAVTLFLQQLPDWLSAPMKLFTFLGYEEAFMLIFPLIYWCIDAALGIRMGVMLILSNGLNTFLKVMFHTPRPYWIDNRVKAMTFESSFGLPSGHAQNAASVWGLLGVEVKRIWRFAAALPLSLGCVFFIGASRLYLGVHFLRDVLIGWLVGLALLWAFTRTMAPVERWLAKQSLRSLLALSASSTLVLVAILLGCVAALQSWSIPQEWIANVTAASAEPIDPLSIKDIFTLAGTWFGFTSGAAWYIRRFGQFDTGGSAAQKAARYLLGMLGVVVLYAGLGQLFPDTPQVLGLALRFLRYTLIGSWVAAAAPLFFTKIGLTAHNWRQIPVQSS